MKKQSAFSLIEVLITLLILSIGVMGTGKMLLESTMCYRKAELQELATTMASSIVDALYMDVEGKGLAHIRQYWQERLENIFPGCVLTIQRRNIQDRCTYTIMLQFAAHLYMQPLTLSLAV